MIAGRYRSDSTDTNAMILDTHTGPLLRTMGRFGSVSYSLECLAEGIWRAKMASSVVPFGGVLSFAQGAESFHFSSYLTHALPFRRCA